jgi:hypothetical protein
MLQRHGPAATRKLSGCPDSPGQKTGCQTRSSPFILSLLFLGGWQMRLTRFACCALAIFAAVLASAANLAAAETKTSKERLSDKASDEQRVDNCRVPPTRRGAAARPDCPKGETERRTKGLGTQETAQPR